MTYYNLDIKKEYFYIIDCYTFYCLKEVSVYNRNVFFLLTSMLVLLNLDFDPIDIIIR